MCLGHVQSMIPRCPDAVETVLAGYPPACAARLRAVRALIFAVARDLAGSGAVHETLKWGQPSYVVKTGTPLRLGIGASGEPALLVHCQTTLIAQARDMFSDVLTFEGHRAICLSVERDLPEVPLRQVIRWALTYKVRTAVSDRYRSPAD